MKNGFTLLEMTATLLLVGILAVSVTISLLPMSQALMQVRDNTVAAQKARLAMARIAWEFTTITNLVSSGPSSISYQFLVSSGSHSYATRHHTLSWGGTGADLLLQDDTAGLSAPLSDDVAHFGLTYEAGPPLIIQVVLESRAGGNSYSNRIVPRNILPGP